MKKQIDALRFALDALRQHHEIGSPFMICDEVIERLQDAIDDFEYSCASSYPTEKEKAQEIDIAMLKAEVTSLKLRTRNAIAAAERIKRKAMRQMGLEYTPKPYVCDQ